MAASFAMEAAVNVRTCFYRSGYDISIPLAPRSLFPELATVHPLGRRFFLAFKVRCWDHATAVIGYCKKFEPKRF